MKKKYLFFFFLFLLVHLSELWAGINIDTTYTHGPSQYHEIAANVYLTTPDNHLTVQVGSIFSEDSINTKTSQLYNVGVDISLTEGIGLWANYNFAPEYSYEVTILKIIRIGYLLLPVEIIVPLHFNTYTMNGGTKFSLYNRNKSNFFKTSLDLSLGSTSYKYEANELRFPNKTTSVSYYDEIKQNSYTLELTETLADVTTLSYFYTEYDYSEDPLLLPPRLKMVGLQGGVLPGFPQHSNQVNISQDFFNFFTIGLGYVETKSKEYILNEDPASSLTDIFTSVSAPVDILSVSYTASLDYYLSHHLTLYGTYNLNKDSTGAKSKYISTGISYSF